MAKPSRIIATAVVVVTFLLLGSIVTQAVGAEVMYLPEKQSVMMFPMKNGLGPDKAQMADDLVVMLKDGLALTGKFMVMSYDLNGNVCIQRAITEQKIKLDDVKAAFPADPQGIARAQKVCQAIASDIGIVGSLDSYSFDEAKKEAKLSVTIQVVRPGADPATIAVSGMAAGKAEDQSQTESGIALAALNDAADKALSKLVDAAKVAAPAGSVPQDQQVSAPEKKHKSYGKGFLPAMLGALLLGVALGGN